MSATSAAVYTRFTGISPVVKNCSRRSACLRRKAATSFCSQSAISSETCSSDFGSSVRFMTYSLRYAISLFEKFHCERIWIAFPAHQAAGKRTIFALEILREALQQHYFGGLAQPELRDRVPTAASHWAVEHRRSMPLDRVRKLIEAEARYGARAYHWHCPQRLFRDGTEHQHLLQISDGPVGIAAVAFGNHVNIRDFQN